MLKVLTGTEESSSTQLHSCLFSRERRRVEILHSLMAISVNKGPCHIVVLYFRITCLKF